MKKSFSVHYLYSGGTIMEQDAKPNILWLCTDQQRFDTLGCYGNKFVHTPNLDRLAASGVRFANAYAQNPVCTPSRASFLTGRYPHICRARQNGVDIPESETLVTRLLHDAGYIGGLSGKLHLSTCNYSVAKFPSAGSTTDTITLHGATGTGRSTTGRCTRTSCG